MGEMARIDRNWAGNMASFYDEQLRNSILSFWLSRAVDREYGGLYTCFDNTGEHLLRTDKYIQAQGRFVWLLSKLVETNYPGEDYLQLAKSTVQFIKRYAFLENGHCINLVTREGNPPPAGKKGVYDTNAYADCFVVLGLAKYAAVTGDSEVLDIALRTYDLAVGRFASGDFRIEPAPPDGCRVHGRPMFLLNAGQELARTLEKFGHPRTMEICERYKAFMWDILENFLTRDYTIKELVKPGQQMNEALVGRYANPGLCLQEAWFILQEGAEIRDKTLIATASQIIEKAFEIGWDNEFGGICLFVDQEGGKPRGTIDGFADYPMVGTIQNCWDQKYWWPQVEALYSTLLCYQLTDNPKMLELFKKAHSYVFGTFPQPNKEIGEWIQMRDRHGSPLAGGNTKDVFHITRSFILIKELLEERLKNNE